MEPILTGGFPYLQQAGIPRFSPLSFPNYPSTSPSLFVVNWVAIGDSLTAGPTQSPAGPALWTFRCSAQLGTQIKLTNLGQGGQTLLNMIANVDKLAAYLSQDPGVLNLITYQGGINDVVLNQATPGTTTVATLLASYQTLGQALISQGWNLVVPWNVEASIIWNNATFGNVDYTSVANGIRAAVSGYSNAFIDIAADPILGPAGSYSELQWYLDNTHKTINGDERKAHVLAMPILNNALAPVNKSVGGNAVYGIYPDNGPIGQSTEVGIRVTNLTAGSVITSVTVGGQVCSAVSFNASLNTVFATVPAGSASGNVVVVVNGLTASGGIGLWTANNVPIIAKVQPNIILPSIEITITGDPSGANFQAGMIPTIQGLNCTSVVIVSTTEITCTTPAGIVSETAGVPLSQVIVAGSPQTSLSQVGVVPASVVTLFQVTSTLYNSGAHTLKDVGQAITLTGANAPTYVSGALGGLDGISMVAASTQTMANNSAPAAISVPFSTFCVVIIPAWNVSATRGGIVGANNNPGFTHNTTTLQWTDGPHSVAWTSAPDTVGLPGNFLCLVVDNTGASGAIYLDGTNVGATNTGALTSSGLGISWAEYGGFYGTETVMLHGIANDEFSTAERTAMQWICNQQYGTAYP